MARDVGSVLLEGELLGRDTHGLRLLAPYLEEIEAQRMLASGVPRVLNQRPVAATWDGQRLPGPWLLRRAIEWAAPRAKQYGSASVAICRSHDVGCLGAYLEPVARAGLLIQIACSDPGRRSVAPFGGVSGALSTAPVAIGIPTSDDPILVDLATALATDPMSARLQAAGVRGARPWWADAAGRPTDDPAVLEARPPGTILPLGGAEAGHKGYALALAIEALTAGLGGHGRTQPAEGWGVDLFLQIHDPDAFAGEGAFLDQMDRLAADCRQVAARDPGGRVRLPGERALARKREQLERGVALQAGVIDAIAPWARRFELPLPSALG